MGNTGRCIYRFLMYKLAEGAPHASPGMRVDCLGSLLQIFVGLNFENIKLTWLSCLQTFFTHITRDSRNFEYEQKKKIPEL